MRDIFYKLLMLLIISSGYNLNAQQEVSKTIHKSFEFTNAGKLKLKNKYGNIIINGWNQNEIQITIDILVTKKEKADAKDLLERIQPLITSSDNFIKVFSNIEEKSSSFFSRILDRTNPFDFDKGNIQINYTINLPTNSEIEITNKFGDIIINEWNGKLKTVLEHGDIWINNDLTNAIIKMKFGNLRAKSIIYSNIELKNSELDLETSKDLKIKSSGSTIHMNTISNLEIYSNKDKIIIKDLQRIQGELKFSNMTLENIQEDIHLSMNVADFYVNKILKNNPNIIIKQKSSELNINITNLNFDFSASLEQGLLRIPKSFKNIKNNVIDNKKRLRNVTGTYGTSNLKGKIQITGTKGVIILKED